MKDICAMPPMGAMLPLATGQGEHSSHYPVRQSQSLPYGCYAPRPLAEGLGGEGA